MTDSNYTHLLLVADCSGSMSNIAGDMNGGIRSLLKEQAALDGKLLVDVWTFASTVGHGSKGVSPEEVTHPVIVPTGLTAMFDGIGTAVSDLGARFAALPEEERPGKVIVVVVTDGQENASQEWDAVTVKALVKGQEETYSWDFIFLGANIDSATVGDKFGVSKSSTLNYVASAAGANYATSSMSSYIAARRGGDSTTTLADIGAQQQ